MTNPSPTKETLTSYGRGSRTHIPDYSPILFYVPDKATTQPKDVLLYGVGIDDSTDSADTESWSYNTWKRMLESCYDENSTRSRASYADCTVKKCWHRFSDFRGWFDRNCIAGHQLDKDILVPGNRVYSPDTCCFVPQYINLSVRWWRKKPRSGYSGVDAFGSGFQAGITHKASKQIGEWRTSAIEAHCDWQRIKAETVEDHLRDYLREVAPDLRVVRALLKYVDRLRSNADAMVPTHQYQH